MLFSVPKSLAFLLATCSMVGPLSANTYMPGLGMIAEEFGVGEVAAYQTLSSYLICFATSSLSVCVFSVISGRSAVMIGVLLCSSFFFPIPASSPRLEPLFIVRIFLSLFACT